MKIFALCKPYLLSQKYNLAIYVAVILASTAVAILSPYVIGAFLDNLIEGGDVGVILRFSLIFGGLSVLKILKGYVIAIMYVKIQARMSYALNMDAVKHVQNLSLAYANNQDSAYLSQRVGTDSTALIGFCISVLQNMIKNVVLLAVPFAILLSMNRFVSLLMIGFVAVYTALYFAFRKTLYNASYAFREAQAKFFSKLYELFKYIRLLKLNSIQAEMNKRADTGFFNYFGTAVHNQKVNYLYSGLDGFVSALAQIALFVTGGLQVLNGNFTIGMFTVFTTYFGMMLGASRYFFGVGASYQQSLASHDRLREILDRPPEGNGLVALDSIRRIEVQGLGFAYSASAGRFAVRGLNAVFEKGNMYAIAGENGAGKSTLVSLLMGMYIDEYAGRILYNGTDVQQIDMRAARKNLIGFAEQEPQLIDESVGFNLTFRDGVTHSELEKAGLGRLVKLLSMGDFIGSRTLGYEINEKNTNTSGGEKQKISILRVLLKNPDVMIFDEPTSALDAETAKGFIEYLCGIKSGKIIIIITHDVYVRSRCDEVIEMSSK